MHPSFWHPPIVFSSAEHAMAARMRRTKLFVCLRRAPHELFPDTFQAELATSFGDRSRATRSSRPHHWPW